MSNDLEHLLPKLRPFQRIAFELATGTQSSSSKRPRKPHSDDLLGTGRMLLADEMGLGKTVTSLAIMAHYREEWPLLILCPASLRHTWPGEIEKFLPGIPPRSIYVCNGWNDVDFRNMKDLKILVVTYSLLQGRSAVAKLLVDSNECNFRCVIADESHNLKQKNSQRSQLALPILKNAKRLLLLSGTPALARPVELWLQLHVLAPDLFGSYSAYTKEYCNAHRKFGHWDVSGMSNAQDLHAKMARVMVRRLKSEVLQELPPKQRMVVPTTITDKKQIQECQQIMEDLKQTRLSIADLVGEEQQSADFEARRMLMQAYQASGIAKAQAVADYLIEWLTGSGSQKVLVFCHHKAVMDTLEVALSKKFKGVGHIRIDGTVPAKERAVMVRKFQTTSRVRVGLLSITACGVGLTLTAASTVMFAELHWTPGVLAQAEDRCHRIGQRNAVNILYFCCKDKNLSVDTQLWEMLGRKIGVLDRVVEGSTSKRRAKMAATEVKDAQKITQGQSVQEELMTFFAETAMDGTDSSKPKEPSKGSIMSFFSKMSNSKRAETQPSNPSVRGTSDDGKDSSAVPSNKSREDNRIEQHLFEWTCENCTFENSRRPSSSGWLACEMCQTSYSEGCSNSKLDRKSDGLGDSKHIIELFDEPCAKRRRRNTIPGNNGRSSVIQIDSSPEKSQSDEWACQVCTFLNPHSAVKCTMCQSPRSQDTAVIQSNSVVLLVSPPRSTPAKEREAIQRKPVSHVTPPSSTTPESDTTNEFLLFSVSKNSGRITIHYSATLASSMINFDINDVLSEKTVDQLAEAHLTRSANTRSIKLVFNQEALVNVAKKLDSKKDDGGALERKCKEIKDFVTNFLQLREIEKKALKDSGDAFGKSLKQSVAQLMTRRCTTSTTERFTGGAKERAQARLVEGTATAEDKGVLAGWACAWCAKSLPEASRAAQAIYCSQVCAEDGRLRRGGMYASKRIRDQVFAMEGGVCALCKIDAHALYTRICSLEPAERLSVLCNAHWKLPKSHVSLERLLQHPKEGDFWQADHIVAVAEGGGDSGLDNYRTLCVPCHVAETEKLRARLRLNGGPSSASDIKHKQMDIRSSFFSKRKK